MQRSKLNKKYKMDRRKGAPGSVMELSTVLKEIVFKEKPGAKRDKGSGDIMTRPQLVERNSRLSSVESRFRCNQTRATF